VRPGRARHRTRPALSWSCAALRGLRPRPTRTVTGSAPPARRFDARRALASRDLPSRIAPDGGPPCAFALLQRSIATPPHRPAGPKADRRTMLPPLGFLAVRHVPERWTRVSRSLPAPRRVASGVWIPPSRRPPSSLPTPCGAGASIGFPLQGVLLASIGPPFGGPCPRGVARVDSPRPPGGRADAVDSRASIPARILADHRIPKDPMRGCLLGVHPPEHSPPPAWAPALFAGPPPSRVGWCDVRSHLRLGVLRRGRVGWPLSGLPALLGFVTLRPSRERSDRRAGRAHVFASRLARVAGGANRSEPRRKRPGRRRSADPSPAVHR
jgi:hypothetical protein